MPISAMPGPARRPIIALVVALTAACAGAANGQSDRDLREENQRLRTQVNDLQRELDAARTRIADMERELQALMRRLGETVGSPPTTTTPQEQVTVDESVPNASPRALLRAVRESYADATEDLEMGDFESSAGSRQRAAYLRAVESWAKRIQREMRSSVVWCVETLEDQGDEAGLRVTAIDPETKVVLGDPFTIRLSGAVRHKLDTLLRRGRRTELILKGVLVPEVTVNPNRIEAGAFDNPPLIGPFAEFNFVVTANSLTPPAKQAP